MVTSWSFLHLLLPCLHSSSCGLFEVAVFVGTQVGISFDGLFSVSCLVEQNSSCLISLFAFIFSNFSLAQPWPHWLVNTPSGLSLVPLNLMLSCCLCSSAVAGTAGPPLVRVGVPPFAPPRAVSSLLSAGPLPAKESPSPSGPPLYSLLSFWVLVTPGIK